VQAPAETTAPVRSLRAAVGRFDAAHAFLPLTPRSAGQSATRLSGATAGGRLPAQRPGPSGLMERAAVAQDDAMAVILTEEERR
jgi:hypothetical protein